MSRERELKLALSLDEAARLEALLGPPRRVTLQRNHYLDTGERLLRRLGYALRLRSEEPLPPGPETLRSHTLTLKGPTHRSGALADRLEEERTVAPAEAAAILERGIDLRALRLPLPADLEPFVPAARLFALGMLENERRDLAGGDPAAGTPDEARAELQRLGQEGAITLELDRTRFPDGTRECELEVEFAPQEARIARVVSLLQALFARAGVRWVPQERGKFARFLERGG
jgi:hypothetical protein